eukprot:1062764-Prorocentrum_minimum.AAC.1
MVATSNPWLGSPLPLGTERPSSQYRSEGPQGRFWALGPDSFENPSWCWSGLLLPFVTPPTGAASWRRMTLARGMK